MNMHVTAIHTWKLVVSEMSATTVSQIVSNEILAESTSFFVSSNPVRFLPGRRMMEVTYVFLRTFGCFYFAPDKIICKGLWRSSFDIATAVARPNPRLAPVMTTAFHTAVIFHHNPQSIMWWILHYVIGILIKSQLIRLGCYTQKIFWQHHHIIFFFDPNHKYALTRRQQNKVLSRERLWTQKLAFTSKFNITFKRIRLLRVEFMRSEECKELIQSFN